MKYLYKNIVCYQYYGRWHADYCDGQRRFGLHRACSPTKKIAYIEAKMQVDYLNGKETV